MNRYEKRAVKRSPWAPSVQLVLFACWLAPSVPWHREYPPSLCHTGTLYVFETFFLFFFFMFAVLKVSFHQRPLWARDWYDDVSVPGSVIEILESWRSLQLKLKAHSTASASRVKWREHALDGADLITSLRTPVRWCGGAARTASLNTVITFEWVLTVAAGECAVSARRLGEAERIQTLSVSVGVC